MDKQNLFGLSREKINEIVVSLELPSFTASQITDWLYKKHVGSIEEMTNLSKKTRQLLDEKYTVGLIAPTKVQTSSDGTKKYLYPTVTEKFIESAYIPDDERATLCVSTQIGCKMGCLFCMTGKQGFQGNLTAAEIVNQIHSLPEFEQLTNVVYMGMGEPLDNYKNVLRFLELVSSENGLNIGMRHISLSTCGLVEKIYDLADRKLQLTLSVSLHAPNDEIRSRTMPVNRKWNVEQLLKACRYYSDVTGRRISFEYAMISGVNDSDASANELASRLRGIIAHVNLIPVNDVTGTGYRKSGEERLRKFTAILEKRGITATVRRTLGSDIEASCGQLRRRNEQGGTV